MNSTLLSARLHPPLMILPELPHLLSMNQSSQQFLLMNEELAKEVSCLSGLVIISDWIVCLIVGSEYILLKCSYLSLEDRFILCGHVLPQQLRLFFLHLLLFLCQSKVMHQSHVSFHLFCCLPCCSGV